MSRFLFLDRSQDAATRVSIGNRTAENEPMGNWFVTIRFPTDVVVVVVGGGNWGRFVVVNVLLTRDPW